MNVVEQSFDKRRSFVRLNETNEQMIQMIQMNKLCSSESPHVVGNDRPERGAPPAAARYFYTVIKPKIPLATPSAIAIWTDGKALDKHGENVEYFCLIMEVHLTIR
jgi:hypothetical protein